MQYDMNMVRSRFRSSNRPFGILCRPASIKLRPDDFFPKDKAKMQCNTIAGWSAQDAEPPYFRVLPLFPGPVNYKLLPKACGLQVKTD